jgi:hypothetical protein
MSTEQQLRLREILEKFEKLSDQPFSLKRESDIDDVFAELMRFKFESGDKDYKDHDHPDTRTRCFAYKCDDKKHHLLVGVIIIKGKAGEAKFTIEKKF